MNKRSAGRHTLSHAAAILLVLGAICGTGLWRSSATAAPDDTLGVTAWSKIASVLQHPRCLNCHQQTSPLQGDTPQPHTPFVTRGIDGTGSGAMRCSACHKNSGNDPMSGTPGAPRWRLAPVSMVWQDLSAAQLCAMLKDPIHNGARDGQALLDHMKVEPLVLWGWAPGHGRAPIPIAHPDFMILMHQWVASGMPCPK